MRSRESVSLRPCQLANQVYGEPVVTASGKKVQTTHSSWISLGVNASLIF